METAHDVPRQWLVVTDDPNCVSTAGRKQLSQLTDSQFIDCNNPIDARLVAAAPELLRALEMFVSWDETGSPVSDDCFYRARAAIAKAKGIV